MITSTIHSTTNNRDSAHHRIEAGLTCGPTVYNYAHIGNFRAYMFEDLLKRTLEFCGIKVKHVMNLTDVDDKTIRERKRPIPLNDYENIQGSLLQDIKTRGSNR